jgi:hypothetical protein
MREVAWNIRQGGTYTKIESLVIKLSQRALYDESTHVHKPIASSQDIPF